MRTILLALSLFISIVSSAQSQTTKKETFKVAGNCGMCKKHIENAVVSLPGISSAVWNKNTKLFTVVYQPGKVSVDSIQSKIAAAGYDTPKYKGNDAAYNELDPCCQYDRVDPNPADKKQR